MIKSQKAKYKCITLSVYHESEIFGGSGKNGQTDGTAQLTVKTHVRDYKTVEPKGMGIYWINFLIKLIGNPFLS